MAHAQVDNAEALDAVNITNPEHASHHIVTPFQYVLVFATLLVFTLITVGAAYIDMHWANPVVALGIACFKATIVILFFMHIKYSSRLIKLTLAAGFFTFLILIAMTMADYASRAWGQW